MTFIHEVQFCQIQTFNAYALNSKEYHLKADEEIRTLDPLLGKEMLYH